MRLMGGTGLTGGMNEDGGQSWCDRRYGLGRWIRLLWQAVRPRMIYRTNVTVVIRNGMMDRACVSTVIMMIGMMSLARVIGKTR